MSNQDDIAIILNTEVVDCKELIQLLSSSSNKRKQILDVPLSQWQRWTDAIEHKAPADLDKQFGIKEWKFPVFDDVFANVKNETEEIKKKRRAANVFYANCLHNHLFKKYEVGESMKEKWYNAIKALRHVFWYPFSLKRSKRLEQKDDKVFGYFMDVTYIGYEAFAHNQLTSIRIPDTVTYIGYEAFAHNQLTSVNIPNGVTQIGIGAFAQNQLTSVSIPDSVTHIRDLAFANNDLTSITIPDSVTDIGNDAFAGNDLESVTIPESVKKIGDGAFSYNQLASLIIPDHVEYIGLNAFYLNNLKSVTIPDSVKKIASGAFSRNYLRSVSIPDNTIINNQAFDENVKIIRRSSKKRSASSSGGAGPSSKRQRMKLIGMQLEAALKF